MKKAYYIQYFRDFSNCYALYWAEQGVAVPQDWERITRREAESLCRKERSARHFTPAFASYADAYIFPADWPTPADATFAHYDPARWVMCGPYVVEGVSA